MSTVAYKREPGFCPFETTLPKKIGKRRLGDLVLEGRVYENTVELALLNEDGEGITIGWTQSPVALRLVFAESRLVNDAEYIIIREFIGAMTDD